MDCLRLTLDRCDVQTSAVEEEEVSTTLTKDPGWRSVDCLEWVERVQGESVSLYVSLDVG